MRKAMATCDRCGKEFEAHAGELLGVQLYAQGNRRRNRTQCSVVSRYVDLCEPCWAAFKEWVLAGKAD